MELLDFGHGHGHVYGHGFSGSGYSMKTFLLTLLHIFNFSLGFATPPTASLFDQHPLQQIPVAFKGRFRPLDVASRLQLYEFYQVEQIENADLEAFHSSNGSALDLFWKIHFLGHDPWDNAPIFHISNTNLKDLLGLETSTKHISYHQAFQSIYEDEELNLRLMQPLLIHHFLKAYLSPNNRAHSEKLELAELSPGLWIQFQNSQIVVASAPKNPPWNFLKKGFVVLEETPKSLESLEKKYKKTAEAIIDLMSALKQYSEMQILPHGETAFNETLAQLRKNGYPHLEIAQILENTHPLFQRIKAADKQLKLLPSKKGNGDWLPIKALKLKVYNSANDQLVPISNFTAYTDDQFNALRSTYQKLENAMLSSTIDIQKVNELSTQLANELHTSYSSLAGTVYKEASGKTLSYPSWNQLSAELIYYQYPFVTLIILSYAFAFLCFSCSLLLKRMSSQFSAMGLFFLIAAFGIHTLMLAMRCYILQRPPVSNMFETVIYVPWIAVAIGLLTYSIFRQRFLLISCTLIPTVLLLILQITNLNQGLENPQAVLDSQYWLTIHVLLVVGSYGAFVLSGILGHFYLGALAFKLTETPSMKFLAQCILQTLYIGVAMLVPGTILGGVWAAESWGRFWDWDPKESWAFISICTYLIFIHAYRFHHIKNFGLAAGSIIGFQIITFTWYGVNYILGTGLHTYGFGSGGEGYYALFIALEALFLGTVWYKVKRKVEPQNGIKHFWH
jgi:ABC-type transport system involved in cytochrome c biogenesis permease subunit